MGGRTVTQPRGVLRGPSAGSWTIQRWHPAPSLAPYVAWHWAVSWDVRGRPAHRQATLPHPSAHLVVEDGRAALYGPARDRFERVLTDAGQVVGVRFRAAGLRPLLGKPMSTITNRRLPAAALPGLDAAGLARAVDDAPDRESAVTALESRLLPLLPAEPDPSAALAERAVALLSHDRRIQRVHDLADRLGLSVRTLQRLFAEYVGVGPSWVIRRNRMHDALSRAHGDEDVDWARTAAQLGYSDQAHLVRDFTDAVGTSPARYRAAAVAREDAGRPPGRRRG